MTKRLPIPRPALFKVPQDWPTPDEVAIVILAACVVAKTSPERVCDGTMRAHQVTLGRAYAALALDLLYPGLPKDALARMVGSRTPESYFSSVRCAQRSGTLSGFNPLEFTSVLKQANANIHLHRRTGKVE